MFAKQQQEEEANKNHRQVDERQRATHMRFKSEKFIENNSRAFNGQDCVVKNLKIKRFNSNKSRHACMETFISRRPQKILTRSSFKSIYLHFSCMRWCWQEIFNCILCKICSNFSMCWLKEEMSCWIFRNFSRSLFYADEKKFGEFFCAFLAAGKLHWGWKLNCDKEFSKEGNFGIEICIKLKLRIEYGKNLRTFQ